MTSPDVTLVANERRETWCGSGYKYPCVCHVQSVVGIPDYAAKLDRGYSKRV